MNLAQMAATVSGHANSNSTDKLAVLVAGLEVVPQSTLDRVQSVRLRWAEVEGVVVPDLDITFK